VGEGASRRRRAARAPAHTCITASPHSRPTSSRGSSSTRFPDAVMLKTVSYSLVLVSHPDVYVNIDVHVCTVYVVCPHTCTYIFVIEA